MINAEGEGGNSQIQLRCPEANSSALKGRGCVKSKNYYHFALSS